MEYVTGMSLASSPAMGAAAKRITSPVRPTSWLAVSEIEVTGLATTSYTTARPTPSAVAVRVTRPGACAPNMP